jgi:predicted  nucleic acid-binding Zn-ribbon protein
MWNWTKENAGAAAAIATIFLGLAAIIQFGVLNPIHQRFDAINQRFDAQDKRIDDLKSEINQRFDAQDKYMNQRFNAVDQRFNAVDQRFNAVDQRFDIQDRRIEDLAKDISELRKLSERVSRNEGQIDVIRQQLQTADTPSP